LIAVDATGVESYRERHCEHCLSKKSKNGKVTYFHYVLEAKLVTSAGHALSLASEWIENPAGEFNKDNVREIASGGRLRWKIENEGFNTQKHGDYQLEHKFCRKSYNGLKNYYSLLQIAHAIIQLIEKGELIASIRKIRPKESLHSLWDKIKHFMIFCKPCLVNQSIDIATVIKPDSS